MLRFWKDGRLALKYYNGVMKILPSLVAVLVLPLVSNAEESLTFASLGSPAPLKFAAEEMVLTVEDDAVVVSAPSFWKCGWQITNPTFPLPMEAGDKPLVIVAGGSSANQELVLRLRLVSKDWSRADFYDFPLTGLNEGDSVEFAATTPFGTPSEQENGGLSTGENIGAIQFLFRGAGKLPIQLNLQKILVP